MSANPSNPQINEAAIFQWHAALMADRGERAELRRCAAVDDVMLAPAFARLVCLVVPNANDGIQPWLLTALARTAFLLSRADRLTKGSSFPKLMAAGNGRPVSAIRANALFRIEDTGEACLAIASMLPLVGRGEVELDPYEIFTAMRFWERVRRDWATRYYVAAQSSNQASAA